MCQGHFLSGAWVVAVQRREIPTGTRGRQFGVRCLFVYGDGQEIRADADAVITAEPKG